MSTTEKVLDDSLFVSLEPEDRRSLLAQFGKDYGLDILIETGTQEGLTPWFLKGYFKTIHTIELDPGHWERAKFKFSPYPNVTCHHGNSGDLLPGLLKNLHAPALVWLDGHYSGPGSAYTEQSTPIREELAALFADKYDHLILIDDARVFGGGPEHSLYPHYAAYPDLSWIEDQAEANRFDYELTNDIIRLKKKDRNES